jgi:putative oxidoreductase
LRPNNTTNFLIKEKEDCMNVALWIVQGLLAFAFIAAGAMKLFAYEKYKIQSQKNGPTGITRALATFIGIAEIAGSLGIVLPMATNIAPWLSPWAAVGLATIMLLAIGFHVRRHESPVAPVILFLLAAFVVFGRFSHWT